MKLFVDCEPDDFVLATRAAKFLLEHPEHKDAILAYENGVDFFVRRTKTGISAKAVTRARQ